MKNEFHWDLHTLSRMLAGALLLVWAQNFYEDQSISPICGLLTVACAVGGLSALLLSFVPLSVRGNSLFDKGLLASSILVILSLAGAVNSHLPYGTDSLAWLQHAATLIFHGANPYAGNYVAVNRSFGISAITLTLSGSTAGTYSYPAGSFIFYIPFLLFARPNAPIGLAVDVLFAFVALLLMARMLPRYLWPGLAALLLLPQLAGEFGAGIIGSLYLPFLILALYKADRFCDPSEKSLIRFIGPLALGVACSIQQTPWFIVPYLVVMVGIEARARGQSWYRVALAYFGLTAFPFVVINLPFLFWNFPEWAKGVFLPLQGHLIPDGVGLVGLTRLFGGNGDLFLFTVGFILANLAALTGYVGKYSVLKRLAPIVSLLPVLFSPRSLLEYFLFVPLLLLITFTSWKGSGFKSTCGWAWRGATLSLAGALLACGLGFLTPAPLGVRVVNSASTAKLFSTTLEVTNKSDHTIAPHFIVMQGGEPRAALNVVQGPRSFAPGQSTVVVAQAVRTPVFPGVGAPLVIEAVSVSPDTVSFSYASVVR